MIEQFAAVDEESKYFELDVRRFMETRRNGRKESVGSAAADTIKTELRICISSMGFELRLLETNTCIFKPVAKLDAQLVFTASFEDEIPRVMDFSFSSLSLYSLLSSRTLFQFSSPGQDSPALKLCCSMCGNSPNAFFFSFPALEIWFHFPCWAEIIQYFGSYTDNIINANQTCASYEKQFVDQTENFDQIISVNASQSVVTSEIKTVNALVTSVKSDYMGMTLHFPISVSQEGSRLSSEKEGHGNCSKSLTITAYSRGCEFIINDENMKAVLKLDSVSGDIAINEESTLQSWPFFRLYDSMVTVETPGVFVLSSIKIRILSDTLNVWLSYQVFHFWGETLFPVPEAHPSPTTSVVFQIEAELRKASLQLTDGRVGPL